MIKHKSSIVHFSIISLFFFTCLILSSNWNQFYPIGERIRDYALLMEQQKYLFSFDEPWMSGTSAHYYLFWYKVGGILGKVFSLSGENSYLLLLNFCWTLYFSVIYFFSHKILKLDQLISTMVGILILFSSNWAGIGFALDPLNKDWWHVSRVIEGAITEFPAWSYLLADLHPHLMNLCLPPLFLFIGYKILEMDYSFKQKIVGINLIALLFVSIFLNSNPWDSIAIAVLAAFLSLQVFLDRNVSSAKNMSRVLFFLISLASFGFFLLKPSMKATVQLRLVMDPVTRTPLLSFFQHWGLWLLLIILSSGFSVYFKVFKTWIKKYWVVAAATTTFWLLPEIVYLDDAYGFPNERMNFIFKIYSFTWVFTGLWFVSLLSFLPKRVTSFILILALAPGFLFFTKAYGIRVDELQRTKHALDLADRNFPGSKDAILKFRLLPDGVTVQSAIGAYDYTSFIATMSDKKLYLGWPNHMSLLNGDYGSVMLRMNKISEIYNGSDCQWKYQVMKEIGASYLVLSTKELSDYPQINQASFFCFKTLIGNPGVKILSL